MSERSIRGRLGHVGYSAGRDGFALVGQRLAFEAQWGRPVWWLPRFKRHAISPSGRIRGFMVGWLVLALRFGRVDPRV